MSFYHHIPTYQVETSSDLNVYPNYQEADIHYQKNVSNNVPCEFFRDGYKQKEYKPIS